MRQVRNVSLSDDLLELQALLEREWPARRAALHASGVPLNEGGDADEEDDEDENGAFLAPLGLGADDDDWGDRFDASRAKELITKLRRQLKEAVDESSTSVSAAEKMDRLKKDLAEATAQLKAREDAKKSETEKLSERAAEAERVATSATLESARLRVALAKGLTETQAKRLIGSTQEELEADADELLASFKTETTVDETSRRPRERLRPGAVPSSEPEETDPLKLAAQVPRT